MSYRNFSGRGSVSSEQLEEAQSLFKDVVEHASFVLLFTIEEDYGAGITAWMAWMHVLWDYTMVRRSLYREWGTPDPVVFTVQLYSTIQDVALVSKSLQIAETRIKGLLTIPDLTKSKKDQLRAAGPGIKELRALILRATSTAGNRL